MTGTVSSEVVGIGYSLLYRRRHRRRRVGQLCLTLSSPTCPVLEGFYRLVQLEYAALRDPAPQEIARRAPGQLPEIAIEMRLVVVAGAAGQLGPADLLPAVEPADHPMKADDARQGLGRHSDLLAEARDQMLLAPA